MRVSRAAALFAMLAAMVSLFVACAADAPQQLGTTRSALERTGEEVDFRRPYAPDPRVDVAMVYDTARRQTVLFGGSVPTLAIADLRDLWEYAGDAWRERTPETGGPSARRGHALAYDEARQRTVLFGGVARGNEVWEWDGWTWDGPKIPAGPAPSARANHVLGYDSVRQRVILFGGDTDAVAGGQTWEWDGAAWTDRTGPGAPPDRVDAALAFDVARERLVLFGGRIDGVAANDTWEWDGATWTQRAAVGPVPAARGLHGLAYDADRGRVMLYGGYAQGPGLYRDLWEWNGTSWTEIVQPTVHPAGTTYRHVGLTYDRARHRLVLFDGSAFAGNGPPYEVWEWDGAVWKQVTPSQTIPIASAFGAMAWHAARQTLVIFGGVDITSTDLNQMWEWNGRRWGQLASSPGPSGRRRATLVYDSARDRLVTFGGAIGNTTQPLQDTWEWDGAAWSDRSGSGPKPTARTGHVLVYDAARARVVLFGGSTVEGFKQDTWTWDGTTWTQLSPAQSPSPRFASAAAYDAVRERVVLFGGIDAASASHDDVWEWDGGAWTAIATPAVAPSARSEAVAAYDARRQRVVIYGGTGAPGSLRDVWEWDGAGWTGHQPRAEWPTVQLGGGMAYDAVRQTVTLYGGLGITVGVSRRTWQLFARGARCTAAADSTTGSCLDGVACEVADCAGDCASCDVPGDRGRCARVILADDPVTCSSDLNGKSCDRRGECKAALGYAAQTAAECGSGFLVDGVCCETAACGPCLTCNAASKAIPDNGGRCGTQRSGLDLHDACDETPAVTCGQDGTCDGLGRCRAWAPGTECGAAACVDNRATARVCGADQACAPAATGTACGAYACTPGEGCRTTCQSDAECAPTHRCETGACVLKAAATCTDDHTLTAPDGARTDCRSYKCVDSACKSTCERLADCNDGFVCDRSARCVAERDAAEDGSGCSCHTTGRSTRGGAVALLLAVVALARRRRARAAAVLALGAGFVACRDEPTAAPAQQARQALERDAEQVDWRFVGRPAVRSHAGLAYDENRDRLVLYGGETDAAYYLDFWESSGLGWTQGALISSPGARTQHRLAYDSARRLVTSFGGLTLEGASAALWEYGGTAWSNRTPTTASPAPRTAFPMAYDTDRHRLVVAGGLQLGLYSDDVWEWDGASWEQRVPAGARPTLRAGGAMAYDSVRKRTVLFGGYNSDLGYAGDTWTWDGNAWSDVSPAVGPSARSLHSMEFDRSRAVVVLYGGADAAGSREDVWEWNGVSWQVVTPADKGPARRREVSMAYDPGLGEVVAYGGQFGSVRYDDLWSWNGIRWSRRIGGTFTAPSVRAYARMAYDPDHQELLLFGGYNGGIGALENLWAWNGSTWAARPPTAGSAPAATSGHGLAYDVARHELVLFGGENAPGDQWSWDGAVWTKVTAAGPSPRRGHSMAYDAARGRIVLFGGYDTGAAAASGETWEWDGAAWTNRTATAGGPGPRSQHTLVYDEARQRTVLFGGLDAAFAKTTDSVWEWDGATWTEQAAAGGPPSQTNPALTYDPARGLVVAVVRASGAIFNEVNETWDWDGVSWRRRPTPYTTSARSDFAIGTDVARRNVILFGGFDGTPSYVGATFVLGARGGPCTGAADSTTGFCVDGVSCTSRACVGTCEACNTDADPGHCAPVVLHNDPDTCGAAQNATCDREGSCRVALGKPAAAAAECASGFLVDGVCCDVASCGACRTCDAQKKEIRTTQASAARRAPAPTPRTTARQVTRAPAVSTARVTDAAPAATTQRESRAALRPASTTVARRGCATALASAAARPEPFRAHRISATRAPAAGRRAAVTRTVSTRIAARPARARLENRCRVTAITR